MAQTRDYIELVMHDVVAGAAAHFCTTIADAIP